LGKGELGAGELMVQNLDGGTCHVAVSFAK